MPVVQFNLQTVFLTTAIAAVWCAIEAAVESYIFGAPNGLMLVFLAGPALFGGMVWLFWGQDNAWRGGVVGLLAAWILFESFAAPAWRPKSLGVPTVASQNRISNFILKFDAQQLKLDLEAKGYTSPSATGSSHMDGPTGKGNSIDEMDVYRAKDQPRVDLPTIAASLLASCQQAKDIEIISADSAEILYESKLTRGKVAWSLSQGKDENQQVIRIVIEEEPKPDP